MPSGFHEKFWDMNCGTKDRALQASGEKLKEWVQKECGDLSQRRIGEIFMYTMQTLECSDRRDSNTKKSVFEILKIAFVISLIFRTVVVGMRKKDTVFKSISMIIESILVVAMSVFVIAKFDTTRRLMEVMDTTCMLLGAFLVGICTSLYYAVWLHHSNKMLTTSILFVCSFLLFVFVCKAVQSIATRPYRAPCPNFMDLFYLTFVSWWSIAQVASNFFSRDDQ